LFTIAALLGLHAVLLAVHVLPLATPSLKGCRRIGEKAPAGIEYELKRLHYDIGGTAYRPAIAALTSLVPGTQILFGSDNPFVPLAETADGIRQLGFSARDLQRIGRDNALALLPRLKSG
jgi:predicted TIM-barrel fold metal-dependent hydrolase